MLTGVTPYILLLLWCVSSHHLYMISKELNTSRSLAASSLAQTHPIRIPSLTSRPLYGRSLWIYLECPHPPRERRLINSLGIVNGPCRYHCPGMSLSQALRVSCRHIVSPRLFWNVIRVQAYSMTSRYTSHGESFVQILSECSR